jgi:hypothetical protein
VRDTSPGPWAAGLRLATHSDRDSDRDCWVGGRLRPPGSGWQPPPSPGPGDSTVTVPSRSRTHGQVTGPCPSDDHWQSRYPTHDNCLSQSLSILRRSDRRASLGHKAALHDVAVTIMIISASHGGPPATRTCHHDVGHGHCDRDNRAGRDPGGGPAAAAATAAHGHGLTVMVTAMTVTAAAAAAEPRSSAAAAAAAEGAGRQWLSAAGRA